MPSPIREVEQKIIGAFVRSCLAAGYRLGVSLDRGYDHDDGMLLGSTDFDKIMSEAFSGDDCHIFIQPADGPLVEEDSVVSVGWVWAILGNSGWDVISDHLDNDVTHAMLVEANKISEYYSD